MALPPGFELEQPAQTGVKLPPGFQLEPASATGIPGPRRTWAQTTSEAVSNIPSSAQRFVGNLYEAVTSPVETAKGVGMAAVGGLAKLEEAVLPEKVRNFVKSFARDPKLYDQAVATANAVGGFYKDRYGSVDQLKNTLATDPVGAAADLSTILSGGAVATTRVAPATSRALATASQITDPITTAAVKTAGAAVRGTTTGASNVISAVRGERAESRAGEILRQAATDQGRRPSNVAVLRGELRQAPVGATGAQAAAAVEAPQLQALGEIVGEQRAPGVAGVVRQAEEEGRRAALASVTPDIAKAEEARRAATGPLYEAARAQTIDITPDLDAVLKRLPRKVMSKARELANLQGRPFTIEAPLPSPIVTPTGAQAIPSGPRKISGDALHYIKLGIDSILGGKGETALSSTERGILQSVKQDFLNQVETSIPVYGQARQEFARLSPPINQAQVLGRMQDVLAQPAGVGERAGPFLNALGAGEQALLKKSTGFARYQSLSDVLTPEQMSTVERVAGELKQGASMADQAMRGRQALNQIIEANTLGIRLPGLFSAKIQLANDTLALLQGRLNNKVFDALEKGFQSGKDLDALIGKVPAKDRIAVLRALGEASEKLSVAKPRIGAQFQASQNALAPNEQPQNALVAP